MKEKVAVLSVYNKEGIVDFGKALVDMGWTLLASGGTAKVLAEEELPVREVAELVGGNAILGHKVVTLSRELHAAILADPNSEEDVAEMGRLGLPWVDLVCVDMYPLQEEIKRTGSTFESVIEKTDIGGPTILRAAAKSGRIVICDPADREGVLQELRENGDINLEYRNHLAAKAERVVAEYVLASAKYRSGENCFGLVGEKVQQCKYGENAWQDEAIFYAASGGDDPLSLRNFELVTGTVPSYNNFCDLDRLLQVLTHICAGFEINYFMVPPIVVACKHGNPCGASIGGFDDEIVALEEMIAGDPRAILGGSVITNFPIGEFHANTLMTYLMEDGQRRLLDTVIAPFIGATALEILGGRKRGKCRCLENLALLSNLCLDLNPRFRQVRGGFLVQPNYIKALNIKRADVVKIGEATAQQERDMILAWAIGSTSNSNTITLVRDGMLLGNGVAQQDRVGACKLAVMRAQDAGHNTEGAVAYSDSFFPFPDGPEVLHKAGIKAIFTSSGSVNDDEVFAACKEWGIVVYSLPDKEIRGFFGH